VLCWQPPPKPDKNCRGDEEQPRKSANVEAADVVTALMMEGVKTLVFVPARKTTELMVKLIKEELHKKGMGHLASQVGASPPPVLRWS
jgi:ATP-dependent helicase YprA (DUF1998 family)